MAAAAIFDVFGFRLICPSFVDAGKLQNFENFKMSPRKQRKLRQPFDVAQT